MRGVAMHAPGRRGTTLVDAMIGVIMAGLIGVIIITLAMRQGALGAAALTRAASRAQWAEARAMLDGDLATVGQGGSRLVVAHDTAIELEAHVGVALACQPAAAGSRTLTVTAQSGTGLLPTDGWLRAVAAGDSVLAFDPVGGSWLGTRLTAAPAAPCPAGALAGAGRMLILTRPLAADLPVGVPVQVRRRMRWNAYRASDGRWYLGVRERTNGSWAIVQPAAGPLDASLGRPRPFAVLDVAGAPLAASAPPSAAATVVAQPVMLGDVAADRTPVRGPIRRRP